MQSISVAIAKDKLPLYLHLAESGETIEVTRHGKPVAIISSVNPAVETPSAFELAYHRFRMQLESDKEYTDAEWERIFDIPRPVHSGPRHPEDFE